MIGNSVTRQRCSAARHRKGAVTLLAAVLAVAMLGMVAFSVDVGYVLSIQQELQRAADSAALAACWEFGQSIANGDNESTAINAGRAAAAQYAAGNKVGGITPQIDSNYYNSADGDLVFGEIEDLYAANAGPDPTGHNYNGVKIRVRRDQTLNGEAPLFFARVFGRTSQGITAEATAGYLRHVSGVKAPSDGGNVKLLPFALDEDTWLALLAGDADDDCRWDAETGKVIAGSDGVLEVNLFPQGTGSPGNRGTVDIGSNNNSTADIARQILYGVSPSDMAYHNNKLQFDENGELELNGDTGISAGVKDELTAIIGQPRMIPIFSQVQGPGNNAQFTIVRWAGVRIVSVKLTGPMKKKHVTIQPAPMVMKGVTPGEAGDSNFVYSPVVLVK